MWRRNSLIILLLAGLSACAGFQKPVVSLERPSFTETGAASWYGAAHHGRLTASGEVFDMHGMTAAHRTLPLDTIVRVTNTENGRMVKLRINDRGPYAKGRVIDLSAEAAKALGIAADGVGRVKIESYESDQPQS